MDKLVHDSAGERFDQRIRVQESDMRDCVIAIVPEQSRSHGYTPK